MLCAYAIADWISMVICPRTKSKVPNFFLNEGWANPMRFSASRISSGKPGSIRR